MEEEEQIEDLTMLRQVVNIVSAFVSHNSMRASDLPDLINAVHGSLHQLTSAPAVPDAVEPLNPAVPIKKSVQRDHLVCLEDGKKFKSLRRHLSSFHRLTPDEYRARWSLPSDYPMVAPAYSETRSILAKSAGLGHTSRSGEAEDAIGVPAADAVKPQRGRPRKST